MSARMNDEEEDRVGGDGRDDRVPTLKLDDSRDHRSTSGGLANAFRRRSQRRRQRGKVFPVEGAAGPGVNEETIAPQNHHGLDTFALREGPHEVVYGGQWELRRCSCEA